MCNHPQFSLDPDDRDILESLVARRNLPARPEKRARLLLALDERDDAIRVIVKEHGTNPVTAWRLRNRYNEFGFYAIYDNPGIGNHLQGDA